MTEVEKHLAQAERCHRLAKGVDERTRAALLAQARECEVRARLLATGAGRARD